MNKFGENIVYLRRKANMSQGALAEKLFVTPQAVSRWENGQTEPDLETIKKIAEVFGVAVEDVINGPETAEYKKVRSRVHAYYVIGSVIVTLYAVLCVILSLSGIESYPLFLSLVILSLVYLAAMMTAEIVLRRYKLGKVKPKHKESTK